MRIDQPPAEKVAALELDEDEGTSTTMVVSLLNACIENVHVLL